MYVVDLVKKKSMSLSQVLATQKFAEVFAYQPTAIKWLDFTAQNTDLLMQDFTTTSHFNDYVFGTMLENAAKIGLGGYAEPRVIYSRSTHFGQQEEARSIHLGIDIWTAAGTKLFCPADGKVHSFAFNDHFGDYGPTIVIEHQLADSQVFYTLYGHLSLDSIENLMIGQSVLAGQEIARIGDFPVNGDWPPHLHFQIIENMQGFIGDYPGVCKPSEQSYYLSNCPDPNLILGVER